ncbi:MAG: DUF2608 domain-containing protein [Parachlamydiaceae bacterium]|nr:DUF2608 domain-containing protein [Parachlamydiaceae bacterium]
MSVINNFVISSSLVLSAVSPLSAAEPVQFHPIESLKEINTSQPDKTIFFLDLDDTVFDFPLMLGSKAWRRYIVGATKKIDPSQNWHDKLTFLLAKHLPLHTVEEMTSSFVNELQEKGYVVCGLTSRERNQWYNTSQEGVDELTINQLKSVNIDFNNNSLENNYPFLAFDSEYHDATFFADTSLKGDYLIKIFKAGDQIHFPKKAIFIDDKDSQVTSVINALNELGIENEGYYYKATEEKAKSFDPWVANIQLYYFVTSNYSTIYTDEEAASIKEAQSHLDANYYLEETLKFAKSHNL